MYLNNGHRTVTEGKTEEREPLASVVSKI